MKLFIIRQHGYNIQKSTIDNLKGKTIDISGIIFKNNGVYCVETNQDIFTNTYWKRNYIVEKDEITIGGNSGSNCEQGLAYIFSQDSRDGRGNTTNPSNDNWNEYNNNPSQLALRAYLSTISSTDRGNLINKIGSNFKSDGITIDTKNKYIQYRTAANNTYGGNNSYGERAYEIYQNAMKVKGGEANYTAKIYKLHSTKTNNKTQNLIIVKSTGEGCPNIQIPFKKIDKNGTLLGGAIINVVANENCTIEGDLSQNTGNDGNLGSIKIKPIRNTGTVKIKVQETVAPSDYKKLSDTIITINYNKSTGAINSITCDKNTEMFQKDGNVIKIKNEVEPRTIEIQKVFKDSNESPITNNLGELYKDVEFSVYYFTTGQKGPLKINGEEIESGKTGTFILKDGKLKVENINGSFKLQISETKTADGYLKASKQNIWYSFAENKISTDSKSDNISINSNKLVSIINKQNPSKTIVVQKTDLEGNALPNIKFDLDVKLARICMIGDKIYLDGNISDYQNDKGQIVFPDGARNYQDGKVSYKGTWNKTIIADGSKDGKIDIIDAITDENGQIKIEILDYYRVGDVTLDGKINAADARFIMRMALGREKNITDAQCLLADVDQDGYISYNEFDENDFRWLVNDVAGKDSKEKILSEDELLEALNTLFFDGESSEDDNWVVIGVKAIILLAGQNLYNNGMDPDNPLGSAYDIANQKIVFYGVDNGDLSESEQYDDSRYTLRTAAMLDEIKYSLLAITATEKDNVLYQDLAEKTSMFYYFGNSVIEKEEYDNKSGENNLIKDYLENDTDITESLDAIAKDAVVTMQIENTPKPYSLELQKFDPLGNKLGEGYKFTINIDNAYSIKIHKDYFDSEGYSATGPDKDGYYTVTGAKVNCKTDNNGIIKIEEIYAKSVESNITVKETAVANNIFGLISDATLDKKVDQNGNIQIDSDNKNVRYEGGIIKVYEPLDILELNLNKKSSGGQGLKGAEFKITINDTDFGTHTTNDEGKIIINNIDVSKFNLNNSIIVTLEETEAPEGGYVLPEDPKYAFEFKYNYNNGNPKYDILSQKNCNANSNGKTLSVDIINARYLPDIVLFKTDSLNKYEVEGAKFTVSTTGIKSLYTNSNNKINDLSKPFEVTTNDFGIINLTKIEPQQGAEDIKITITEIETQKGLKLLNEPIEIEYKYDTATGEISGFTHNTQSDVTVEHSESERTIYINAIDSNVIETLKLHKTDSVTGASLPNTEFTLDFGDKVKELKVHKDCAVGYSGTSEYILVSGSKVNCKTNSNGDILLKDIVITEKDVTCKVTETKVPTTDGTYYYKEMQDVYFNISYKEAGKTGNEALTIGTPYLSNGTTITVGTVTKNVSELAATTCSNYDVTFNLKNVPLIDLDGQVWLDGQQGIKDAQGPNGQKENNENGLDGVDVYLYKNGQLIRNTTTTTTNLGKGIYSFKGLERPDPKGTNNGYQIQFEYSGVTHQETDTAYNRSHNSNSNVNSDASENLAERNNLNSKFTTITPNGAEGTAGTIPLDYEYNQQEATSKLKYFMNGTNPANNNKDFAIKAYTGEYKTTTSNIDCGLVEREFDLALGTDVKSARLEINDKSTTYDYAQIMDGKMEDVALDEILQGKSSGKNVKYNLYLYVSDYNYRIADYKTDDEAIENKVNKDDNNVKDYDNLKELQAYVTYNVVLKGQTTQTAKVNKFEYYYDSVYTPYKIDGKEITGGQTKYTGNKYDFEIDSSNRKITFTSRDNTPNIERPNFRVEVNLEFRVNKNANGYVELKPDVKNIVEITEYSTAEGGLIDQDSAPGNADITIGDNGTPIVGKYEDDTDEAAGINISLRQNEERTIEGTVFEDAKGEDDKYNGKKDDAEKPVNDVIVQLIEVKKIGSNYYEYIWQETKSGSGNVKKMHGDGKTIEDKQYREAPNDGTYEFTGYIPGNYIIRYIYGDGTTTYDITDNVKTYNGQDYKSTVDDKYNKQWYNTAGYETGDSVARDNEARRLEVMAYSTTINKDNGEALERRDKEDLENTWMCAETSRINVPVDADNKNTSSDSTTASYDYTRRNNNNTVEFLNMNFGLAERPRTNLVLEKHITGLKITPNGTGVQPIVDAKVKDIESIVNGGAVSTQGITQGLAVIKSTRENRGFWEVATDVEELTQGAQLEVEYTYVVRNDSDKDYLSKILVNAYEGYKTNEDGTRSNERLGMTYQEYLNTLKYDTRGKTNSYGTYLGQTYYLGPNEAGSVPDTDAEVTSRVETLEEALNNDLIFDETSGEDFKKNNDEAQGKIVYDTNGASKEEKINTVVESKEPTEFLTPKAGNKYEKGKDVDYSKTITLKTVLSSSTGGELGANLPSYIAEVVKYSNAAGRRDMDAEPENLAYVHSDDKDMTMDSVTYKKDGEIMEAKEIREVPEGAEIIRDANQNDEFWGETIIITKPTGEDKITSIQIAIITVSSMAVLGVGIVLIKKFVLKK